MKVILMQDVAKIGRKHSIVEVPDGYGRNQLIPKGLAKPATPENMKLISKINNEKEAKESALEAKFFATKKSLDGKVITLSGLKSSNGHLFAAIKPNDIIAAAKQEGVEIESSMLNIPAQIKSTGEHVVFLIHGKHKADIKVNIE